ncbi:hypothetical protein B0H16DRAFT_1463856 [Mycena metata]|uniref:Uncharacterized protein n=1 Tax=Mycena metata TaxID=1033252 RepID=A0AAD7N2A7_9AGAR|nr:hypothetical protein B0H16DRAFT_1463856 [Mycena metata]
MSDEEGEVEVEDPLAKVPGIPQIPAVALERSPHSLIHRQPEGARTNDTAMLKNKILVLLHKDGSTPFDPPLASTKVKAHRGMAHPTFAKALTPMEWPASQTTWSEILEGTTTVTSDQLPVFLFPLDQVFPVGADRTDAVWLDVVDNALKGKVVLRSAKAMFMGPESALEGDGYHKGRPGNASIISLLSFTPRVIAWVTTQVYFALSSKQDWYRTDGDHFNYEDFFWNIYGLFEDKEWGQEIIALWDKVVLGTKKATVAATPATGRTHLQEIKAARAARRAAGAAPAS